MTIALAAAATEAEAGTTWLAEIVALVAAAGLIAYVCQRLGVVPIVGFLLAGVAIGPHALGLVRNDATVEAAAEIGVLLLLFTIGAEFSIGRLVSIRRLILGGGSIQVGLVVAAVTALALAFGRSWQVGVFTGCLLALSSTAIVLKLHGDRGTLGSPAGQVTLGLLIFQDLAVVVMVLLVPLLAGTGGGGGDLARTLGTAIAVIAAVLDGARRLVPRVLEVVARACVPEVFLLAVVAICLGTAFLTSLVGVSVSLGAFLAGLVVSESRFRGQALGEVLPLQILFSATFFVSVGMLLDPRSIFASPLPVLGVVVGVVVLKVATSAAAARLAGTPTAVAVAAAFTLAQVGEFAFVLERAEREAGLVPFGVDDGAQVFVASAVLLMVSTPLLDAVGVRLRARLEHARPSWRPPRWTATSEARTPSTTSWSRATGALLGSSRRSFGAWRSRMS